jgi:hypothetical protein
MFNLSAGAFAKRGQKNKAELEVKMAAIELLRSATGASQSKGSK